VSVLRPDTWLTLLQFSCRVKTASDEKRAGPLEGVPLAVNERRLVAVCCFLLFFHSHAFTRLVFIELVSLFVS